MELSLKIFLFTHDILNYRPQVLEAMMRRMMNMLVIVNN